MRPQGDSSTQWVNGAVDGCLGATLQAKPSLGLCACRGHTWKGYGAKEIQKP
ncbi:hypothetical protein V6Z11_A05G290100 [Gossypium hirsutum]